MLNSENATGCGGERILVVEDSPTQAEQLRYILGKHGFQVAIAGSALAALNTIRELKPALVISDIIMPEMNGYELCRRIKALEECHGIPVILLTSLSDTQDVIRALECGADNFFTKPYDEEYLLSRVTDMLENRSLEPEYSTLPGLEISFTNQKHVITSDRRQMLNLLLSTYETATLKNRELAQARNELREINDQLEIRVAERTAELDATINLLRVETAERLHAMEELRRKDRLLTEQSRLAAMGEMINNIAHQWRQPLNVLGMTIQQLSLFYESDIFNKDFLDKSVNDSMKLIQHMSKTIDDFRNFFKPDKEMANFNVNQSIEQTVSLIDVSFKHNHIQIITKTSGDAFINGYPSEFSQAILNILQNARDALIERNISNGHVSIATSVENDKTVITIADNAGGIRDEIINRVFEPYFSTKGLQGTGIGLNMSKNIIETNMRGRITVRNIAHGAEFRIEI